MFFNISFRIVRNGVEWQVIRVYRLRYVWMSNYEERFVSIARVYGESCAAMLREAHICIIGIGGVGCWTAEALARTGAGNITLVDGDTISRGNTNRQIHTLESSLGHSKSAEMQKRILDINPECNCHIIDKYLGDDNLSEILDNDFSIVIDAIDRIKYKAMMIHHCKRNKIPMITIGGAGGLLDPTKIEISDLSKNMEWSIVSECTFEITL